MSQPRYLWVSCPTCGAAAGAHCLVADILEGVSVLQGGHLERRSKAEAERRAPIKLSADQAERLESVKRAVSELAAIVRWPAQFRKELFSLIRSMEWIDARRAGGVAEEILEPLTAELRERVSAFCAEHYPDVPGAASALHAVMGLEAKGGEDG